MSRAAVMVGPSRPIEVRDYDLPELEDGGLLLETICSEVCGTDVHLSQGRLAGVPYPIIPGHMSVGKVVQKRGVVVDVAGAPIEEGQVVTFLDVHGTCNACWYCLVAEARTRCPQRRVYGVTLSAEDGLFGGWAQHVYLLPGAHVVPLGDTVSPRAFIAGGCALPTALHAVDRAQLKIGDTVAVQGAGPVGLCAARLAVMSGAGRVIIIDQYDNRLAMARSFGVDHVVKVGAAGEHLEAVRALTDGRGADVTIEATGAAPAFAEGIAMTRDAGRYVVVGQYTDTGEVGINPHRDINKKHLDIRGVWGIEFNHFYRSVELLKRSVSSGGPSWEGLISREYGLDELNEALDDVANGRVVKAIVAPNA